MPFIAKHILWVDCLGALLTGILLAALSGYIAPIYNLPQSWVIAHACVHLAYGSFSLSLAVRRTRPIGLISTLAIANAAWAVLCIIFAARMVEGDSVLAAAHFLIEGIYVGTLGFIEWNRRENLAKGE